MRAQVNSNPEIAPSSPFHAAACEARASEPAPHPAVAPPAETRHHPRRDRE